MNVAILGSGLRCRNLYLPALRAVPGVRRVGVWSRNLETLRRVGSDFGVEMYPSLDAVLNDRTIDVLIVCIGWTENGDLYKQLGDYHGSLILETPLGTDLAEAEVVAGVLENRSRPTLIAEQYHLRPLEVLKRDLIRKGVFGDVLYAFNDGVGHEYHGVSLIRSYLGFQRRFVRAASITREFPCYDHAEHSGRFSKGELVEHALLEFEQGALAAYHWSWLSYTSSIRSRRAAGFHGSRGAAWGDEWVVYENDLQKAQIITVERRTRVVNGLEIPVEFVAWLGDTILGRWVNPVSDLALDEERAVAAALILNVVQASKMNSDKLYSPAQALEDHRVVDAMRRAAQTNSWVTC
jgi:predicted dehydrogenase